MRHPLIATLDTFRKIIPLPEEADAILLHNPRDVRGRLNRRPRRLHLSVQSNSSNTPAASFVLLHPLFISQTHMAMDIQMLSLYPSKSIVEILNPSVGLMSLRPCEEVGERRRATIVDLPAASRPRKRIRSCLSLSRCFFRIV